MKKIRKPRDIYSSDAEKVVARVSDTGEIKFPWVEWYIPIPFAKMLWRWLGSAIAYAEQQRRKETK